MKSVVVSLIVKVKVTLVSLLALPSKIELLEPFAVMEVIGPVESKFQLNWDDCTLLFPAASVNTPASTSRANAPSLLGINVTV